MSDGDSTGTLSDSEIVSLSLRRDGITGVDPAELDVLASLVPVFRDAMSGLETLADAADLFIADGDRADAPG